MFIIFIKEFWKQLLALAIVLIACVSIAFSLYNWGYQSSDQKWEKVMLERDRVQAQQVEEIKKLSTSISESKAALLEKSDAHLSQILLSVKNKPLYRIDAAGRCIPSADFERAYSDILGSKK